MNPDDKIPGIDSIVGDSVRVSDEMASIFDKGAEFTRELLSENERLRYRVAQLRQAKQETQSAQSPHSGESLAELQARLTQLQNERTELLERYQTVETENQEFAQRYIEIEEENNNLANLYVCSYQLHSTLDFREVLQVIMEIVINLIGAEVFALYMLDENTNELSPVASEGIEIENLPSVPFGKGTIGEAAASGENYFVPDITTSATIDPNRPMVCIPLKIADRVIGSIVLYRFLAQKTQFAHVDYELFTLLAGHAATAIFSSKLFSESERKRSTLKGFISMLTLTEAGSGGRGKEGQ